ncbi:MAG: hypothetical protein NWE79_04215 [Candidatus Bathyarchaeota archaeon]|nr:hypothetical protein [Candidatus Bathyarchaeota archaeon]
MPSKYISVRERALKKAMAEKDIEALFWWLVQEQKQPLLDGDKGNLPPGLFRLALDHLSRLHMKRAEAGMPNQQDQEAALDELKTVLKLV